MKNRVVKAIVLIANVSMALLVGEVRARGQDVEVKRIVSVEYPEFARYGKIEGIVELTAMVSSDGRVERVEERSGNPILMRSARTALSRWLFSGCSTTDGCRYQVAVSFKLLDGSCRAGEWCPSEFEFEPPSSVVVRARPFRAIVN